MSDESKQISALLGQLIESSVYPDEIQICPICGGKLHVRFGAYKRHGKDLFGATVDCESCGIAMALDYATPPPAWLAIK